MAEIRIRNQGKITVQDADSSNEISLQAPSTVASNQEFTLPSTSGSANNIITTNASGVLSVTDINTLITSDVAWQSTVKTGDFTAVSGEGYFVNTTSAAITATLPSSPSAGDFVAFKDYAENFATNNLTIARNGSNIQGDASNSIISTNRASLVLVYIDSTEGWLYTVENNVGDLEKAEYVTATGGTITTSGDYKIHTFTGDGTFAVSNAGNSAGSNTVSYLVVAGGGGGGVSGGGAGGFREAAVPSDPYYPGRSPLASTSGLPVSVQSYSITIGGGGAGIAPRSTSIPTGSSVGGNGSVFSSITSTGGGGGANDNPGGGGQPGGSNGPAGGHGGSGGSGGGMSNTTPNAQGAGNTPPVSPPQGNPGGPAPGAATAGTHGGGGAGEAGDSDGQATGGDGMPSSITGSAVEYAGGGGGGQAPYVPQSQQPGGTGGGGAGGAHPNGTGGNGTANTGGGAGGGSNAPGGNDGGGGTGGSGVVIIRYKYQN